MAQKSTIGKKWPFIAQENVSLFGVYHFKQSSAIGPA